MGSHFLNRPSKKMFKYILTISLLVTAILAKPRAKKLARSEESSSWEWPSSWDDISSGDWPSSWDDFSSGDMPSSWDMGSSGSGSPAGTWEAGLTTKNQAAVGNGLQAGMTFLQVTGLQVGMIFLLETCHLAGIWEVLDLDHQLVVGTWEAGLTTKNQAAVGNGLQAGMTFLQVTGLQVGMIFLLETFH